MSLWLTAPLLGDAGGAELVAAALPLARPADECVVFRPDQPGVSCPVIDVEVAVMQALPCDGAGRVDAADVVAGRFLYRLAGHAFHSHWHALMREVSDRFVDVRIREAGMRWGSFPSDGRRVCGVMSGFPFVLGEDGGEWVLVVVGEGGSVLWTSRVPCPLSPWGDLHGGSHMSLLLSSLPDLAAMLAPAESAGQQGSDVGRVVVPGFLRV